MNDRKASRTTTRRLGLLIGLMVVLGMTYLFHPFAALRPKKPVRTPTPPLHEAVRQGDLYRVRSLIAQGVDINQADGNGRTALHKTVHYGYGPWFSSGYVGEAAPFIAAYLIDHGAHVNAQDFLGMTPLHRAATSHSEPLTALLLDNDAQINVQSLSGQTPLYMAIEAGEPNMAKLLITRRADVTLRTTDGETALHAAVRHGCTEVVVALIDAGAEINTVDQEGQNALYLAFSSGLRSDWALSLTQYLIDHGAEATGDPPNPDPSILHLAAEYGPPQFTQWLITQGVDLDALNHEGETPLHCALKTRWSPLRFPRTSSEIAGHLIRAGADITRPDRLGNTPLHQAALFGYKDVVETLIARGAQDT